MQQISPCEVPVLICGETGTGKELFARAIHYLSPRSSKPFIPINCAAIPAELFENELFGHVKGAFTGATVRQEGIIQAAAGGTLFLDEIDSIPLIMQAKLLRFLEEKEFKPLGLNRIAKADVRIVSAARNDLRKKAQEGAFRDDLFYRLNVVSLLLPPLRERAGDIPLLAEHFLQKYSAQLFKPVTGFDPGVLSVLTQYNWPGNIRELENAIYHAVAVCHSSTIQVHDLNLPHLHTTESKPPAQSFKEAKAGVIATFERQFITRLLIEHGGNISRAARAAHKHRRAFGELVKKYRIDPQALLPSASS
ncbi:sigma-54 dependent transcriptional regulator [candidate division KSB1 bacterium]|nr:sigma-54 dependent transcriptional regulator [candidate division KSB1 bacterium]